MPTLDLLWAAIAQKDREPTFASSDPAAGDAPDIAPAAVTVDRLPARLRGALRRLIKGVPDHVRH